eukprot:4514091-Prymnesium_polylepis.1
MNSFEINAPRQIDLRAMRVIRRPHSCTRTGLPKRDSRSCSAPCAGDDSEAGDDEGGGGGGGGDGETPHSDAESVGFLPRAVVGGRVGARGGLRGHRSGCRGGCRRGRRSGRGGRCSGGRDRRRRGRERVAIVPTRARRGVAPDRRLAIGVAAVVGVETAAGVVAGRAAVLVRAL